MTIEHSLLTGASLHEPKGVAAAAANKVYVSNGVGSGTWTTITNPFASGLLHVRDEKTSGTAAQTLTGSTWNTRNLNTVKTNEIVGAALSGNQITGLPAGTYYFEAQASFGETSGGTSGKLKLYNITSAADILVGMAVSLPSANGGTLITATLTTAIVMGRFTLAGTSTLELRHYVSTGGAGGIAMSLGTEVYSDLLIWKIS